MNRLLRELQAALDQLEARHLRRALRPMPATGPYLPRHGADLVNLASNDYLGLSQHPRLKRAARDAIDNVGTGAGASRLIVGHLELHAQTERAFARFKHAQADGAALLLPTGYMANLAALTALAGPGDLIALDKLNHASLIDAAHASGATVRTFPHLQFAKLDRLLARHAKKPPDAHDSQSALPRAPRRFIVTDTVFSMDGDVADLPALCEFADRHDAIIVIDEAHATGVLGETGAGLAEAQGVSERIDVTVSTASKALGSLGGIVTAAQPIIDTLVNYARSLIYTTAIPPAQAAAIAAAIEVVRDEPWRRRRVLELARKLRNALGDAGWTLPASEPATPIVPLIVHTSERALDLAAHLERAGLLAVAIRPPTVSPGAARVRVSLRADLADDDLDRLIDALNTWKPAT